MSIVTKKGDDGFTTIHETQIPKDHPAIECLGTIDELDAFLALAEISLQSEGNTQSAEIIGEIRKELMTAVMPVAVIILSIGNAAADIQLNTVWLEQRIAELEKENPVRGFVRTWTKPAAAYLNTARTICRRCERRMVTAFKTSEIVSDTKGSALLSWLNRLSDLLFMLALTAEQF